MNYKDIFIESFSGWFDIQANDILLWGYLKRRQFLPPFPFTRAIDDWVCLRMRIWPNMYDVQRTLYISYDIWVYSLNVTRIRFTSHFSFHYHLMYSETRMNHIYSKASSKPIYLIILNKIINNSIFHIVTYL